MHSKSYYDDSSTALVNKNVLHVLTFRNANLPQPTTSNESMEVEQKSKYWVFQDKSSKNSETIVTTSPSRLKIRYHIPSVPVLKEKEPEDDPLEDLPSIDELTKILQVGQPVESTSDTSSLEQSGTSPSKSESKKQPPKEEVKPFDFKLDFGIENSLPKTPSDNLPQSKFSFNMPQFSSETSTSNNNSFTFNLPKPTGSTFGDQPSVQPTPTSQINTAATSFAVSEQAEKQVTESNGTEFERTFNISYQNAIELMKERINDTTRRGSTALLCACRSMLYHKDKEFRIKALLANGADVNIAVMKYNISHGRPSIKT